jgi:putative tributyrin esterase
MKSPGRNKQQANFQLFFRAKVHLLRHLASYLVALLLPAAIGCAHLCQNSETRHTPEQTGFEPLPVTDVQFFSKSLQRDMHINVILPRGYERRDTRYPVLYLCHGLTSNYHEFKYIGVPEYLNRFDMIVVMVDVGNSFYINWAVSEEGQKNNFADHVCIDVINYVDQHYRTIADRKGRAINGISMGGFGAISLGLSHPELFCSIGSHSGALSYAADQRKLLEKGEKPWVIWPQALADTVTRYRDINIKGYSTIKERTPKGQPFLKPEDADKVDPFKLVLQLPKDKIPHIYLDCGSEDFLIAPAQEFMRLLMENNIPFVYGRSDGVHEEDYWGREISISMAVQYAVMLRNIWGRKFEVYDAWSK